MEFLPQSLNRAEVTIVIEVTKMSERWNETAFNTGMKAYYCQKCGKVLAVTEIVTETCPTCGDTSLKHKDCGGKVTVLEFTPIFPIQPIYPPYGNPYYEPRWYF
jgi:predicted RNA-binding Zn-ribbon protein involved in translation (DUF1610 family)